MEHAFIRSSPGSYLARSAVFWLRPQLDWPLFLLLLLLCCFGLVALHSALDQNQAALGSQVTKILLAFAAMLVVARINPHVYMPFIPFVYLAVLLLLCLVLFVGTDIKGSKRWLRLPYVGGFQPSELMKLALPMVLAWYFRKRPLPPGFPEVLVAAGLILLPVLLVVGQPDLGTAILICSSGILVLWLAGIAWIYICACIGLLLVSTSVPLWVGL